MNEENFKKHLQKKGYTEKSVSSRLARARKAEKILGYDLEDAAFSDDKMYEALKFIAKYDNREQNYQNATRCYYEYKNGKEFPKLKDF